jgi:hypothetical protein
MAKGRGFGLALFICERLLLCRIGLRHVELIIWNDEALDRLAANDVRIDDFVHVGRRDVAVPNGFGIDDNRRAELALIETTRLVGANRILDSPLRQLRFEKPVKFAFAGRIAAAARMALGTLIGANENVFLEFRHESIVTAGRLHVSRSA